MIVNLTDKDLDQVVLMRDMVLIKPKHQQEKTESGLYLPPSINKDDKVSTGYIIKTGPGYALPNTEDFDEPWKKHTVKYLPLQVQQGDLAVYLSRDAIEIKFNSENYYIVSVSAILMCVRDEQLMK